MAKKKVEVNVKYKATGVSDVEGAFDGVADSADEAAKSTQKLNKETTHIGSLFGGIVGKAGNMFSSLKKGLKVAINSFKTLRGAVISTGIGALAIAVLGLFQAFTRSEKGAEKFRVITASLGIVFDLLMDAVSAVGDALIFAIEEPGKAWDKLVGIFKKGFNFLKTVIFDPYIATWSNIVLGIEKGILKVRIAWNEFTGDSEEAEALTKQLDGVNAKIDENIKTYKKAGKTAADAFNSAADAAGEFGKKLLKASDAAGQLQEDLNALENAERDFGVESAKSNLAMEKLITLSKDKTKSDQERVDALKEAGRIERERVEEELKLAEERFRIIREQNALAKSNEEDLQAEADAEQRLYDIRTNFFRLQQRLVSQESALTEALNAEREKKRKEEEDRLAKEEEDRKKLAEKRLEEEKALQERLLNAKVESIEKEKALRQLAFDNEIADLKEKGLLTAEVEKQLRDELNRDLAEIDKKYADKASAEQDKNDKKELDKKKELERLKAQILDEGFSLTNSIFKEGSKQAEAIQRATALTQIGIDTAKAISSLTKNSEANPANSVTFGAAGIAQFAAGAIRIAGNIAKAAKLLKAPAPDVDAGGTGGGASAPSPEVNTDVDFQGVTAGAERFGANIPIRAYVTESEITKSQDTIKSIEGLSELS